MDSGTIVDGAIFTFWVALLAYIGLFLASAATRWQWVLRLGFVFDPLTKVCRLPKCCSFYFLMCAVNITSSLPTLSGFYKNGMLGGDRQVITAILAGGLPVMIWYVFFFTGPIAIGLFGVRNGLYFLVVWLLIGIVQTTIGIGYSMIRLPRNFKDSGYEHPVEKTNFRVGIKDAFHESLGMAVTVFKILVPVVFLLYILVNSDLMDYVNQLLRPVAAVFPLQPEVMPIAITGAFNIIVAFSMAQQLIVNGLGLTDAFMGLIVGMFIYNLFEIFHTLIPYNVAFFGSKLGLRVAIALFLSIAVSDFAVIMMLWGAGSV
ncbi:MAG: hypothetical protein U9N12_08215 [Euryarchaeota archaeon]|nr:hypothetical protein [Euryarchaeota archaeon]